MTVSVVEVCTDPVQVIAVSAEAPVTVVDGGAPGPQGPAGPAGPQGPRGFDSETAFRYVHHQLVAAQVWTINHNLGGKPGVTVIDSARHEQDGAVHYSDDNTLTVTFSAPFGGEAHLS